MIYLSLYNKKNIKIDSNDENILKKIKEHFSYLDENRFFKTSYKMGVWDGKISLFNSKQRTLPYGLFTDLLKFLLKNIPSDDFKKMIQTENFKEIKNIFSFDETVLKKEYNLKFYPRDYQMDCIEKALKFTHSITVCPTGSGKSCIITYIIKILLENKQIKNSIIIVPTLSLINQFKNDMIDYGISEHLIGMANSNKKEFNKTIVISTWQTLIKKLNELKYFDCVLIDECHINKAPQIIKISKASINAKWVLGFTGTLPSNELAIKQIKSYIGPVSTHYSSEDLANKGYLSKCNVISLLIKYKKRFKGDYNTVKDEVFKNEYRLNLVGLIIKKLNQSILILVNKIETEGELLYNHLNGKIKDKKIVFLSGKDNASTREEWRHLIENSDNVIIIATYQIFSVGININSLKHLILLSSSKSKVRILQSIGRSLRQHYTKKNSGSYIWDFQDQTKYLKKHSLTRNKFYYKENFNVMEQFLFEKNNDMIEFKNGMF